jgi:folate-dependent phosphoribosylglycinamide formyltransferase PurN
MIVLLGSQGASTKIIYHTLKKEFSELPVILEAKESRINIIKRRISRLGFITVFGEVLFMAIVLPFLRWNGGNKRIEEIKKEYELDDSAINSDKLIKVSTVNSDEARQALKELNPKLVVVSGTHIIGKKTLDCVEARFINIHTGITPAFRGLHGGYWALIEGRADLVGTTVHFVDKGIDTGNIIAQATFKISKKDSFVTHPYLHVAVAIPILINAIRSILTNSLEVQSISSNAASKLWSHPTLWGYIGRWFLKGVK